MTFLAPSLAPALDRREARELIRAGQAEALEAAFSDHQAAFNAGRIGPRAYRSPFYEFATSAPAVETALAKWRASYPASPQAAYAEAARLLHIAYFFRGDGYVGEVPHRAMAEFQHMGSAARDLLVEALDAEPHHLAAAHALMQAGAFLGSRADRDRGFAIVAELDTPAEALLSSLHLNYARWGGSDKATRRFCEEWAPRVPEISVEQCLAKAEYDQALGTPERLEAPLLILSKANLDYFTEQHIMALARAGGWAEAYKLAKSRGYMTMQLAYALTNGLKDPSIAEGFIADSLAFDPLDPAALAGRAGMLASKGDLDGAWSVIEKAMTYGRYSAYVRSQRINLMERMPDRRFDVLDETINAADETDGDLAVLGIAVMGLMNPPDYLTHRADGTERMDFACKRLELFRLHESKCKAGAQHFTCQIGMTARRDTMMTEAKAQNACGDSTGRSWQDVVRYLLDLTEGK